MGHSMVSLHGQGIEPGHLLIGVAMGRIEPHLDAAATPSAVVGGLVGVTPEAFTQGCRCGEEVLKCAAGGLGWTLVNSCQGREGGCRHSAPGPKSHFWPAPEVLPNQTLKPPFSRPHLHLPNPGPHLRSSPSPCASYSCRCWRCGSLPTSADSPLCTGARSGIVLCASSGSPGWEGGAEGVLLSARMLAATALTRLEDSLLGWGEGDPYLLDPGPQVG